MWSLGRPNDTGKRPCEDEVGHVHASERGLGQLLPPQPSKEPMLPTLILDFEPPNCETIHLCC